MVTKKDKFLAAAQKFLEKGALEKALAEYQRAAAEDAKDTRTWLRIAEIHVKRGENDQAVQVYLKTADLYVEQGFFQRAVAVYKNVIKLAPAYVEAHFKLADIYKQLGLFSDAVQQYEQAASVYQKAGRLKEAMAALTQIVELNPDQVLTRIKLAEVASQAGSVDEAVREFGRAAEQLEAQGKIDDYLRVAERLLFHQPQNLNLAKRVARWYIERQNARFALAKLQVCFNADPRDVETLDMLARAFEQLGQVPKTISVLKELARVYGETGRTADRNLTIHRVLALDPRDGEAREFSERSSYVGPAPNLPPAQPQASLGGGSRGGGASLPGLPAASGPPSGGFAVRAVTPVLSREASGGTQARRAAEEFERHRSITFTMMAVPQVVSAREATAPVNAKAPQQAPSTAERVAIAEKLVSHSEEDLRAEAKRIINEADVFVKYGLIERAVDHLRKVFEFDPLHTGARERLVAVLLQLGRKGEAAVELEALSEAVFADRPDEAEQHARRALELDPQAPRARRVLDQLARRAAEPPAEAASVGPSLAARQDPAESGELLDIDAVPELVLEDDETPSPLDLGDSRGYEDVEVSVAGRPAPGGAAPERALGGTPAESTASARSRAEAARSSAATPAFGVEAPIEEASAPPVEAPSPPTRGDTSRRPGAGAPAADPGLVIMDELLPPAEGAEAPPGEALEEFDNPRTTADGDAGALLAELEQVDFFIEQGMFEDAAGLLEGLDPQYADHPLVRARRQRLGDTETPPPDLDPSATAKTPSLATPTDPLGLGDIDLGIDTEPVPAERGQDPTPTVPVHANVAPRAVVAAGETPDVATHADLGIAYKEMGLFDAAINEFTKLSEDPAREVFALTMIGECYESKGASPEALIHYKKALNRPGVRDDESLQLYFQLGRVFQSLGDRTEALFFFEKVMKRDAGFSDVARRVALLRGDGASPRVPGARS